MSIIILGVRVDNLKKDEAVKRVVEFLKSGKKQMIFTPNPEMLVKADKDRYFKETLNAGDLNICDGTGLWLAVKLRGKDIERIAGVDFMAQVCRVAEQEKCSVYLLGGKEEGTAEKAAGVLRKRFPGLRVVGSERGPVIEERRHPEERNDVGIPSFSERGLESDGIATSPVKAPRNDELVEQINNAKPDVLFVAFGMGKQEKWLRENMARMPSVKIGMGVGGSFDFISGEVKRAPLLMRKVGLEWAYRLVREPRRLGRIWNATIYFIFLLIKFYLSSKFQAPSSK